MEEEIEVGSRNGVTAVDVEGTDVGTKSVIVGKGPKTCDALRERENFDGVVQDSVRNLFEYTVRT
jgi:hypothetical protein